MKVLGVVTARGGSKRFPNKNLAVLGGKPLIAWSIEVGLATCQHVVTTTDSAEIAQVAAKLGSAVVMRPPELALDSTPSEPVVAHAASKADGGPYNAVLLLQPTSPFRSVEDVQMAVKLMQDVNADSVISVVEFSERGYIFSLGHASRLRDFSHEGKTYTPNGAIYLIKESVLMHGEDWYGPHAYGYVMPRERSLDIDTHADFDAAQAVLEGGKLKYSPEDTIRKATAP